MLRFAFAEPGTTKEIYEASDIKAEAQHFEVGRASRRRRRLM